MFVHHPCRKYINANHSHEFLRLTMKLPPASQHAQARAWCSKFYLINSANPELNLINQIQPQQDTSEADKDPSITPKTYTDERTSYIKLPQVHQS